MPGVQLFSQGCGFSGLLFPYLGALIGLFFPE
jgi:hypothetical protein